MTDKEIALELVKLSTNSLKAGYIDVKTDSDEILEAYNKILASIQSDED